MIALRTAAVVEASFFRDTVAPVGRDDLGAAFLVDLRALQAVIPQDVALAYRCRSANSSSYSATGSLPSPDHNAGVERYIVAAIG